MGNGPGSKKKHLDGLSGSRFRAYVENFVNPQALPLGSIGPEILLRQVINNNACLIGQVPS